ncbi:MAG: hypothetical protein ACK4KV_09645 [Rhodocyclaceae bacterium]
MFSSRAGGQLRQRFPSIAKWHEDLVSEAVADITALLRHGPGRGTLPSWYGDTMPSEEDAERFYRLAFSILNRRVADHFRGEYKHWVVSLEDHPEVSERHSTHLALEVELDLRRATHALLKLMERLPSRDRALIEEVALGGSDSPMSERERQHLKRLRVSLQEALRRELGADAMTLIRKV